MVPTTRHRARRAGDPSRPSAPSRIRALPRDDKGRPIPWFVATQPDGTRDFRVADGEKRIRSLRDDLCWVCGQHRPTQVTFMIGPMCVINRVTAEPPMHEACAQYSAVACPFVLRPQMVRRTGGLSVDVQPPPGLHSDDNPGGVVLWTTRSFTLFRPPLGVPGGVMISLGEPTRVVWIRAGQPATREEAVALLRTGSQRLREEAALDPDPASAVAMLARQIRRAELLLPQT